MIAREVVADQLFLAALFNIAQLQFHLSQHKREVEAVIYYVHIYESAYAAL